MRRAHSKIFRAAQCSLMHDRKRGPQHYRTSTAETLTPQALSVLARIRRAAYRAVLTLSSTRW